jgi:bacterioferritin
MRSIARAGTHQAARRDGRWVPGLATSRLARDDSRGDRRARALYQEPATYCASVKDYVTRDLFEELMADEERHIDFLESQLDLVAQLGVQLYAQHHIGELDEEK